MDHYDVVVVGAGSAGAVVAARLATRPDQSVLLLEAGPDHTTADTPEGVRSLNFFRGLLVAGRVWSGLVAQRAEGQKVTLYLRGRGIGGSSAINGMAAIRGLPDDYDRWGADYGCSGWTWPDMLAAFVAIEDDVDYGGDGLHGRNGPVPLARVPFDGLAPLDQAVRAAVTDLGYPSSDDYHAPRAEGLSRWAFTSRDGCRVSVNDAYLESARSHPNLTVRGDAHVDRVLLDGRRAVGVRTAAGEDISAGTVIVSAGTIHSPAILLRSGIGVDDGLPVGANLKEHAVAGFDFALRPNARKASANGPMTGSLVRYTSGLADAGRADMQLHWFDAMGPTDEGLAYAGIRAAVMRVFSTGEVRLRSMDPFDDPVVEFRMLSERRDLDRLRDGVWRMIDIARHPVLAAAVDRVSARGTTLDALDSDDSIEAWLAATVSDYVHAVGTCRMGPAGGSAAVVGLDGSVHGYDCLRVVDASIMPDLPKANTHLTTVAIAERIAKIMLAQEPLS